MERFCPKCGKETKRLIEKVCSDCYSEKIKSPLPKRINLAVCKTCKRIKFTGKMHELDENILRDVVLAKLKTDLDVLEAALDFHETYKGYDVVVEMVISRENILFEKNFRTEIKIVKVLCDSCMKLVSDYFEAIIQLRGFEEEEIILKEIDLFLSRAKEKDELAAVTGIEKKREGIDIKVGSLRTAKRLVRYLSNKYDATLKTTDSVAGFDKNLNKPKKKYTFCLRKN